MQISNQHLFRRKAISTYIEEVETTREMIHYFDFLFLTRTQKHKIIYQ